MYDRVVVEDPTIMVSLKVMHPKIEILRCRALKIIKGDQFMLTIPGADSIGRPRSSKTSYDCSSSSGMRSGQTLRIYNNIYAQNSKKDDLKNHCASLNGRTIITGLARFGPTYVIHTRNGCMNWTPLITLSVLPLRISISGCITSKVTMMV